MKPSTKHYIWAFVFTALAAGLWWAGASDLKVIGCFIFVAVSLSAAEILEALGK